MVAPIPGLDLSYVGPLSGGVSGSTVWRARWDGRDVVAKRTSESELVALRLFADLDEPMLPELLASGVDESGPWVLIPYHEGGPFGITDELPDGVHRCMGRLHAVFAGDIGRLQNDLEPIDGEFLSRALTEFGPDQLRRAQPMMGDALFHRASSLLHRLREDRHFWEQVDHFAPTLLHGDLYGLNVLGPGADGTGPVIIDWNSARIGPAMFDVAMTSAYDSAARRAHDQGWADVAGTLPDRAENELAHAWSTALINAMYAGTVAVRASVPAAASMIEAGEAAAETFSRLAATTDPGL